MTVERLDATVAGRVLPGERVFRHTGRLRQTVATLTYAVDVAEDDRRRRVGLGAVRQDVVLFGLLSLESGTMSPVQDRYRTLLKSAWRDDRIARVLRDPDGAVWATPVLAPPVRPLRAEFHGRTWGSAVRRAHRWNNCAERVVVVSSLRQSEWLFAATEASHYGIGLDVFEGGDRVTVVEPAKFHHNELDVATWELSEEVYAQFRKESDRG